MANEIQLTSQLPVVSSKCNKCKTTLRQVVHSLPDTNGDEQRPRFVSLHSNAQKIDRYNVAFCHSQTRHEHKHETFPVSPGREVGMDGQGAIKDRTQYCRKTAGSRWTIGMFWCQSAQYLNPR